MDETKPKPGEAAANAPAKNQDKPAAAPSRQPKAKPAAPVQPNFQMKGTRKLHHHLFASSIANCKKNVSYNPGQPQLEDLPHKHFFHTMDMRGRKLSVCSMLANHYHDMTWHIDPETGNLVAKSGPPMRMATNRFDDGTSETVPEQVHWLDRKKKPQYDSHTHEWEYIVTEEFTAQSVEAQRQINREDLAREGVNVNPTVAPIQNARPLTDADGITIRES